MISYQYSIPLCPNPLTLAPEIQAVGSKKLLPASGEGKTKEVFL
jgi:hypothetical protein